MAWVTVWGFLLERPIRVDSGSVRLPGGWLNYASMATGRSSVGTPL